MNLTAVAWLALGLMVTGGILFGLEWWNARG